MFAAMPTTAATPTAAAVPTTTPLTTTPPTVGDVLARTHVGGDWHEWNADGGTIRLTHAELRPALEAAYDPSMPDWPATVEIADAPTYEIQVFDAYHGWINSPEHLGHGFDNNRWATEAEAQAAIDELVAVGFDANQLRIALAA